MYRMSNSPNILVFSHTKQRYNEIKSALCKILEPNSYVIYHINDETLESSKSWQSTTKLLVLASDWKRSSESIEAFLTNGGACLSLQLDEVTNKSVENRAILRKQSEGILVTSIIDQNLAHHLSDHFNIKITTDSAIAEKQHVTSYIGYVVAEPYQEEAFFRRLNVDCLDANMTYKLQLLPYSKLLADSIFIRRQQYGNTFNRKEYFTVLKTKGFGRTCLYFDALTSTQELLENCPSIPIGAVVIAKYQTLGRGRSGNIWLSPEGCAMFSFRISFSLQCAMGQHLPLLQHMAALAIVLSIKDIKDVNIGVKWPNDIFYRSESKSTFEKLGGVLVTTTITGHEVLATIGIGVNLNNRRPTVCLNEILKDAGAKAISLEFFVASVLNEMERLVDAVNAQRIRQVLDLYHAHWWHANTQVSVRNDKKFISAKIVGIDDCGFLRVKLNESGDLVTVHPDGNSFDMLNGLIVPKIHR